MRYTTLPSKDLELPVGSCAKCEQASVISIKSVSILSVSGQVQVNPEHPKPSWQGDVRWSEAKWSEVKYGEVRWGEVRRSEVKWSEKAKRSEVKRGEARWSKVKWGQSPNRVEWSQVKSSEVKWSQVKPSEVKWSQAKSS